MIYYMHYCVGDPILGLKTSLTNILLGRVTQINMNACWNLKHFPFHLLWAFACHTMDDNLVNLDSFQRS